MKLKLIKKVSGAKIKEVNSLDAGQVARVIRKDGTVFWTAETNVMGGLCDCCSSVEHNPRNAKIVEIYEEA